MMSPWSCPSPRPLPHALRAVLVAFVLAGARPLPAAADTLPLARVLEQVEAHDPMLEGARHEAAAATSRVRRAGAWDAPMLEFMAENVPVNGRFDMDPMTMRVVGVEQRLDVFGARGLARRAAREGARSEAARVEDRRYERYAMAWEAYADAWYAGERAAAAADHRGVMARMASAARARYEAGRGRLDDLLRVEAERARIVADAVAFEAERQSALRQLAALRGLTDWPATDALEAPPESLVVGDDAAWREAVASHPRVRAAASLAAAQRGRARSMQRMAWPELTVRASYGFRRALDGGAMADGMPLPPVPQDNMWSAGVGLMLPIGTGSRQGAEAAEMNAMAGAASSEQQAETLALTAELGALRAQAEAARRTVALLRDTVLVAQQRALAAAWSSYEAGSTDLTGVFDSAHASYSEELDVSRARQQLARTLARMLAVTARPELFGLRVPEPRPAASPTPQERPVR